MFSNSGPSRRLHPFFLMGRRLSPHAFPQLTFLTFFRSFFDGASPRGVFDFSPSPVMLVAKKDNLPFAPPPPMVFFLIYRLGGSFSSFAPARISSLHPLPGGCEHDPLQWMPEAAGTVMPPPPAGRFGASCHFLFCGGGLPVTSPVDIVGDLGHLNPPFFISSGIAPSCGTHCLPEGQLAPFPT